MRGELVERAAWSGRGNASKGKGRQQRLYAVCIAMIVLLSPVYSMAAVNDFGVGGVLDIPGARMAPEGTLSITYSRKDIVDLFNLTYQPTPWLETSFRYAIGNPRGLDRSSDNLRDRSFEVRARLIKEGRIMPQMVVGIRDLVGTGVFSGEYLVASKAVGPLDLTLGLGWGTFAGRSIGSNPLGRISGSFDRRSATTGQGGTFRGGDFFSGSDVGLFGGLRYQLPWHQFSVVAAYNSDVYRRAVRSGTVSDTDPWSFGVEWEPVEDIKVGASWQQGNQFALRFSSSVGTQQTTARKPPNGYGARGTPTAPSRRPRSQHDWFDRMGIEAHSSGLLLRSADPLDEQTLEIVFTNRDYQYEADAIRRILALARLYAPLQYETLVVTGESASVTAYSIHYNRRGQVSWAKEAQPQQVQREAVIMPPLRRRTEPEHATAFRYPNGLTSASLGLRPFLFDPADPFRYQILLRLSSEVDFGDGWGFSASYAQNLYSQFDEIRSGSDSALPRVRSNVVRYLQEGESFLERMMVTKRGQLTDDVYYLGFAGILEQMYAGMGGEVLYRPFGSRFGFGANIIGVQQREFDGRFGLRDYRTVIGHLSVYWASPLYNFDVAVHAGRYLARDLGATLELNKRFANGWSVGVFATLTDVPFDEFGEGSFDKGITLRIPFNPFVGTNTRAAYSTLIRPVQRDGGQRLQWGTTLWGSHRSTHYDHLSQHRGRMVPQ